MKIQITCKLFDNDARYFIEPILNIDEFKTISLYRDNDLPISKKLKVIVNNQEYLFGYFKFFIRFLKMIKQCKDVNVLIGIYEIPHGLISLTVASIMKLPVIVSVIGNPKYKIRNRGIRGFLTNLIYNKADIITVTGSRSKKFISENNKIPTEKIFILPNSIPVNEFQNKNLPVMYDLITLGRLSPEKGLFKLLDVVFELKESNQNIKLAIAGKGPLKKSLKHRISELKLDDNVTLLGYIDNIVDFLNSGKIFITTSKTEGLPRTVIQSLSCGTPVICSNVGDLSDLIINNETGYIIDDINDKNRFIKKIKFLLKNEEIRLRMSKKGINFVKKHFSSESASMVWKLIFKKLKLL